MIRYPYKNCLIITYMICVNAVAHPTGEKSNDTNEYEVTPNELFNQIIELATVPEFMLSKSKVEQIMGVRMHEVKMPSQNEQQVNSYEENFDFGPTLKRPYGFSWQKSTKLTQYYFQWQKYGKQHLPFERAPTGMCISAADLGHSFVQSGWKLYHTTDSTDLPPSNTYTRGKYGRLRVLFEESNGCLIEFILGSTLEAQKQ